MKIVDDRFKISVFNLDILNNYRQADFSIFSMNFFFMIRKVVFTIIIICIVFSNLTAQQSAQKFVTETNYLLYLPDNYKSDTATKWPLLLFLHGGGESGNDIQKVKLHGPPKLADQGKKFPFIIVSPQSEHGGWDSENLYRLIQSVKKNYRVDEQRIYLTGLSMGGYGTWSLAMKHPEEFAAIAPVCGGGDTADAWKLRNLAVWCFHGAKDDVVPPSASENMVKATRRYNPSVRFTLYPDANHNSWDAAYSNDSLYQWMLSQEKFTYKEVPMATSLLKKYQGRYVGTNNDTVLIIISPNGLIAKPGKDTVPLKAAGENVFFIEARRNMELRFVENKNLITSFWFLADRKMLFRKLKN